MKVLNVSFEVYDDYAENNLRNHLEGIGGKHLRTLPNTDHLKEDKGFMSLRSSEKKAKNALYDYINKNRECV